MSFLNLPADDAYDKQCGKVFLTTNGNIIFHCILCENKYRRFQEYAVHVIDKHFDPDIIDEDCMSTHSSDFLEDVNEMDFEYEVDIKEDIDEILCEQELEAALYEDAIPITEVETTTVMTNDTARKKCVPEIRPKWEEKTSPKGAIKRSQLETKNTTPKLPPKITECKTLSEADKIRMANEAARNMENPTFKQPLARANIPDSERKHKCNFCGFAFKDPSNLIAHIKRHSDKRNFQCAYCSKMFCTRTEIEEHSRRHTGEKPFVCEYENCGKAYFTRSERTIHQKRSHLNERNCRCEICGKSFYDKGDLREHMVSHTQERKHDCMVCEAKFSRRKALVNHMKLHENKREYQCELCPARFNQKPGLSSHMKNKHKIVNQ